MPPIPLFFSSWRFDPVAGCALTVAFGLYAAGVLLLRRRGTAWPVRRSLGFFALGLGSYAWVSFGFLGAYSTELRWAFTTRIALLLLLVPALISLGRPLVLARAVMSDRGVARLDRFLESRLVRFTGNAVFEPLFGVGLFLLFLTPFSGLVRVSTPAQWIISALIPLIGLMTILPIFENTTQHTSFFVMTEFVLAFAALLFDPIPGILLRLSGTVLDQVASPVGQLAAWFPSPLRDQQLSGDLLWFIAEILDVPILIILVVRWNRIERREARSLDELSDDEMAALTVAHLRGPER